MLFIRLLTQIRANLRFKSNTITHVTIRASSFKRLTFQERCDLTTCIRKAKKQCTRLGYGSDITTIFIRWCDDLLTYYGWEEYDTPFVICLDDRFENTRLREDMFNLVDTILDQ